VPLTSAQAQRLRLLTPHEVAWQMHADRAARPTSNLVLNFRVVCDCGAELQRPVDERSKDK